MEQYWHQELESESYLELVYLIVALSFQAL